jgi:hypothetical protein
MQSNKMISVVAAIALLAFSRSGFTADKEHQKADSKASAEAKKTNKSSESVGNSGSATSGSILSPSEMERRGRANR